MALGDRNKDLGELLHKINLEEPQSDARQFMSICVRSTFGTLVSVPFVVLPTSQVQKRKVEGVNEGADICCFQ